MARTRTAADIPHPFRATAVSFSQATILSLAFCALSVAQTTAEQMVEAHRKEAHIFGTEPRRPNGSPRRDNITDEEVREIQRVALGIYPDAIVNISTVTDGCECEEGDSCTSQVWLVLYKPSLMCGLMLSRIGGHWQIGAIQEWWLRYYDLQSRMPAFRDRYIDPVNWRNKRLAWQAEEQDLVNNFPICKTAADKGH